MHRCQCPQIGKIKGAALTEIIKEHDRRNAWVVSQSEEMTDFMD